MIIINETNDILRPYSVIIKYKKQPVPLLISEEDKIQFLTWIGTLQSEFFEQAIGTLNNGNAYCCLGVGCIIFVDEHDLIKNKEMLNNQYTILGTMPKDQPKSPKWLQEIDRNFCKRFGTSITELNDNRVPHKIIADILLGAYEHELTFNEEEISVHSI